MTNLPPEQIAILETLLPHMRVVAKYLYFRYVSTRYHNFYTIQDIIQDAWPRMMAANVYPPADEKQLRYWSAAILRRVCLNHMEALTTQRELGFYYVKEWDLPPYEDAELIAVQNVAILMQVARRVLSPKQLQVVEYRLADIPGREVAAAMDIPHATVRTLFHSAKSILLKQHYNFV